MRSVTALPPVEGAATPAILAGALTLGLAVQFALPATSFPSTFARPISSDRKSSAPAPVPVGDFAEILLRPLFSPSRSAAATATGSEQIAPVGVFTLMGAASAGARASAVLRTPDGAVHALRLGESVDGWRLVEVGAAAAVLTHGGVSQSLRVGAPPIALSAASGGVLPGQGAASAAAIR